MSGTGNSFRVATWMAEAAAQRGVRVRVSPMERGCPSSEIKAAEGYLVGLVLPTHGFTTPWLALRFALRMPCRRGTHAFVVATRAGSKLGSVFVPGVMGTSAYLLALVLTLKGYDVRGVAGVDMPSNWMTVHPGFSRESAEAIIARARPKALSFIEAILADERRFAGFGDLAVGIVFLPISFAYLVGGRFFLSKLFFASERCTGCGICARNCPAQAIRMWGRKRRRPYWTLSCESCMRCMAFCPEGAVEASHPLAVVLYLATVPLVDVLSRWMAVTCPWLDRLSQNKAIGLLLWYLYSLAAVCLLYLLFTLLSRVPLLNRLFTITTLTHYYRRYHEPGTQLSDLAREREDGVTGMAETRCQRPHVYRDEANE